MGRKTMAPRYTASGPWPSESSQPLPSSDIPPARRPVWPWILAFLVVVVMGLCCVAATLTVRNGGMEDTGRAAGQAASDMASRSVPQKGSPPAILEGQWVLGEDAEPGRYKTDGADPDLFTLCVWTVYAKEGGNAVDFGTLGEPNSPGRVTLKKGQEFHTTGCKPWVRQPS